MDRVHRPIIVPSAVAYLCASTVITHHSIQVYITPAHVMHGAQPSQRRTTGSSSELPTRPSVRPTCCRSRRPRRVKRATHQPHEPIANGRTAVRRLPGSARASEAPCSAASSPPHNSCEPVVLRPGRGRFGHYRHIVYARPPCGRRRRQAGARCRSPPISAPHRRHVTPDYE